MQDYAHPEALVSTDWVAENKDNSDVVVVEVDVDTGGYDQGHVPGAVGWNWSEQLCDQVVRDILPKEGMEKLLSSSGINNDATVVLYGDNNNWFAAWAFWQLKVYGHEKVAIMNGGRGKWRAEGRELSTDTPEPETTDYTASDADNSLRSFLPEVQKALGEGGFDMVDVRSPEEFSGEILAPPGLPETCQRGGHIPGASSIPWGMACKEDGTFKDREELEELYASRGVDGDRPVIAYCRIGERSSHTWFVLAYLLGFNSVTNYDGSWTEYGNLVGVEIEKGS